MRRGCTRRSSQSLPNFGSINAEGAPPLTPFYKVRKRTSSQTVRPARSPAASAHALSPAGLRSCRPCLSNSSAYSFTRKRACPPSPFLGTPFPPRRAIGRGASSLSAFPCPSCAAARLSRVSFGGARAAAPPSCIPCGVCARSVARRVFLFIRDFIV